MATIVEPDDFLFWQEIRKAYDLVAVNNERSITLSHNGRDATVSYDETDGSPAIMIVIVEAPDTQHEERLIVP